VLEQNDNAISKTVRQNTEKNEQLKNHLHNNMA